MRTDKNRCYRPTPVFLVLSVFICVHLWFLFVLFCLVAASTLLAREPDAIASRYAPSDFPSGFVRGAVHYQGTAVLHGRHLQLQQRRSRVLIEARERRMVSKVKANRVFRDRKSVV